MDILIKNDNLKTIKINIKELPVTKKIKDFKTYFENGRDFIKEYTDVDMEDIEYIARNEEILSYIIKKFISLNKIDSKEFFQENFYSNLDLINSINGLMIFQLMNLDYKPENLLKLSNRELFRLYLFVFLKNQLEFPTKEGFELFVKLLEENYGKEEKDLFLKMAAPLVEGNRYDIGEEELFNNELKKLQSI